MLLQIGFVAAVGFTIVYVVSASPRRATIPLSLCVIAWYDRFGVSVDSVAIITVVVLLLSFLSGLSSVGRGD